MSIEQQFSAALRQAIIDARELGYNPQRFETMLNDLGAVGMAKKLIKSGELQDGLKSILKKGRADLTLEHIMQAEPHRQLFSRDELAAAAWRLEQAKTA
ncbi:hypothetical protein [Chitinibacter tainanensis]|uniref:hypothetical protein n=1 Tax=Chitinibacter tainanensis TaxID=230667 RepID=UPI002356FC27|nr:hypothetical protein [Chitinibacter tainanensis]